MVGCSCEQALWFREKKILIFSLIWHSEDTMLFESWDTDRLLSTNLRLKKKEHLDSLMCGVMNRRRLDLIMYHLILCFAAVLFLNGCFDDEPLDIDFQSGTSNGDLTPVGSDDLSSTDSDPVTMSGCLPASEPTWENPVNTIMQSQCASCHPNETASYDAIQVWVNSGELKNYCEMGPAHYLTSGKEACLRWVELGVPQTSCSNGAEN